MWSALEEWYIILQVSDIWNSSNCCVVAENELPQLPNNKILAWIWIWLCWWKKTLMIWLSLATKTMTRTKSLLRWGTHSELVCNWYLDSYHAYSWEGMGCQYICALIISIYWYVCYGIQDPESIEIRECFDNYCVSYDDDISRIPMEDLRSALVQVRHDKRNNVLSLAQLIFVVCIIVKYSGYFVSDLQSIRARDRNKKCVARWCAW